MTVRVGATALRRAALRGAAVRDGALRSGLLRGTVVLAAALLGVVGCSSAVAGRGTAAGGTTASGQELPAVPGDGGTGSTAPGDGTPTASGGDTGSPPAAPGGHPPRATTGPCRYAETEQTLANPASRDAGLPPDPQPTPDTGTAQVTLTTNRGEIVITLDRAKAPCAVQSFLFLTGKRFYDNTPCPRVSDKATDGLGVLQCGDPTGTGGGGPTYQYAEENLPTAAYPVGTVAIANGGRDTSGGQFFICHQDASDLTRSYSVIGRVTTGLDVVQRIAAAGNDQSNQAGGGRPKLSVTITRAVA